MTTLDIRRAGERFATRIDWLDSKHSFSFGPHHDPANTGHGLLVVHNDDVVRPGAGFGTHAHSNMEIVSWVLAGELEHRDSQGNHGVVVPGLAQRMSAGTGIRHSEKNLSSTADLHFVQMWVPPDTDGIEPGYEQLDLSRELDNGGLIPIASGTGHESAITIHQRDAVLWGGQLAADAHIDVPDNRHVHVFVARGSGSLDPGGHLGTADAARLTESDGVGFTAGPDGAEVLIWATA
ncbi:MAG: pirin family protein [Ilumatobacter sp.]